jgi:GABA permease
VTAVTEGGLTPELVAAHTVVVVTDAPTSVALAADAVSRDVVFSFLINSCGVTMLLLYLMTSAAQLKLRRKYEAEDPARLQIKMWFHPYGTCVAIAAMLVILVAKGLDPSASKELWLSLLVAGGFATAFFIFRRRAA